MIPQECKRLTEVDFPIAEVSKQSAQEKSIRHGYPSTLHLWLARRPFPPAVQLLSFCEVLLPVELTLGTKPHWILKIPSSGLYNHELAVVK